mmetsp:Transcript_26276/g.47904  ORF Transcript_26276/g.47904 Transcript_26276/m.47904 type:complete len:401 (+) Transcript_26276:114-1316(+)
MVQLEKVIGVWSLHFWLFLSRFVFVSVAGQSAPSPISELSIVVDGVDRTIRVHFGQDDLFQMGTDFCSHYRVQNEECAMVVFTELQNLEFEYLQECSAQHLDCTKTMSPPSSQELTANQKRWERLKSDWGNGVKNIDSRHYRGYVGQAHTYGRTGASHFGLVTQAGLSEEHRFLDIGCGSLRLGRMLIPFLNHGSYFCMEPNPWLYQAALRYELSSHIIHLKAPTFINWVTDFKLPEEYGQMDVLFANSIFSHTAQDLLSTALTNLSGAMHSGSMLFASFFVDGLSTMGDGISCPRYDELGVKGWLYSNPYCVRYDEDFLLQLCKQKGLQLERLDWPHDHQTWYAISKLSGQGTSSFVVAAGEPAVLTLDSKRSKSDSVSNELEAMFEQLSRQQGELYRT